MTIDMAESTNHDFLRFLPSHKRLVQFCSRWKVAELALFGSALRDDFSLDSDLDFLVSFLPEARWSLFDLVRMQAELERLSKRKIDLVERKAIEQSENYIRRKNILDSARVVYATPMGHSRYS